jgi:hypothetical protein
MTTTNYQIIYWRDIPAQVKVKTGRTRLSRQLPERFEQAIDRAAMHSGAINSDDYLAEWRHSDWQEREGELENVADALVAELDAAFPQDDLRTIARNGGRKL